MLHQYQDAFASSRSRGVEYVAITGITAILHGVPRAAFDLLDVALLRGERAQLPVFLASARVPGELLGSSLAAGVDHDVDNGGDRR